MARCSQSDGLGIPNRIHAKPVRRPGSLIAAIIVAFLVVMLVHGMVSNEKFDWPTVWKYLFNEHVLSGIGWTIILTVTSMFIAIVLAVILAVMRQSVNPVLRGVSWFWIWFFRGTPVYTQLVFWGLFSVLIPTISLGIPFTDISFWQMSTEQLNKLIAQGFLAAMIGLAFNESAYLAEIVRAGLEAVDPGQGEAAEALGMSRTLIMRRVILPQAMRIIVPPTGNEVISMLKTTSLVSAVPFSLEIQFATNAIASRIYKPIPLLIVACFWYLVITSVLMIVQSRLEKYFGKGFNEGSGAHAPADDGDEDGQSVAKNDSKVVKATFLGLNA
ncbi:polar amino acid transport system permease protein [Bifidobacterium commune]|uniref:Polar amino acid transport system permease protein n=1 Tax=Bifidobacterium commune TaxID=1505727 RepID=A0A1C4H3F7_9BIFI|nr:amino acid ABC transporter permease [Bifidobacterium commune]MBB2955038.1 polar amino acid transport system permease protein [Bifidobacterium commune]SCC79313.1 polar amino acid transport system permease protein [Bifidobacterium commune]